MSKIVDYFLGSSDADMPLPNHSAQRSSNTDEQSTEEFPWLIKKAESFKSRSIQGKVTHIFNNHGLIDNEVYFSVLDVHGGDQLQVIVISIMSVK